MLSPSGDRSDVGASHTRSHVVAKVEYTPAARMNSLAAFLA